MKHLEEEICSLLRSCNIDCYEIDGNVKMKDLGIDIEDPSQVIEFDILVIAQNVGVIIEATAQTEGNKKKIDEFLSKANNFALAHRQNTLNLHALPKIPSSVKKRLAGIKEWRFVYVGTSEELETKQMLEAKFPNSKDLTIINSEDLAYLKFLIECLGEFARNDVLSHLKIDPVDTEAPKEILEVPAIQLEDKKISGSIDADVFLFQIPAYNLLQLAHIPRHGYDEYYPKGITNYQRLLKKEKLQDIAKMIKKGKSAYSFPNTVTIVLSDDVKIPSNRSSVKEITIPCTPRSLRIIDGQHRIFGYAQAGLSKNDLKKSKIMVVGLKFAKSRQQNKNEAKIFVEINREQTNVPNDLLLLLAYPTLGEKTPKALSAHVMYKLNAEQGGPLQNILATKPGLKRRRDSMPKPVQIVMMSKELAKMFDVDKNLKGSRAERNIEHLYKTMSKYFRILKNNFKEDWESTDSLIYSSKYMTAFVRLLVEYKKRQYSMDTIGTKIQRLRNRLARRVPRDEKGKPVDGIIFNGKYNLIPSIGQDQTTITKFILEYGLD